MQKKTAAEEWAMGVISKRKDEIAKDFEFQALKILNCEGNSIPLASAGVPSLWIILFHWKGRSSSIDNYR